MNTFFKKLIPLLLLLTFALPTSMFVAPQYLSAQSNGSVVTESPSWWEKIKCNVNPFDCALRNLTAVIVTTILQLVSLLTAVGGFLLNGVLFHTVVNVSQNYDDLPAINQTWKVVRDMANMVFIFVLLYAAIQTIIGQGKDTKGLIVRIVMVGVLMNFSLFFTKFVIDVSNVLTLTFYDALVPNAATAGFADVSFSTEGGIPGIKSGLSSIFMQSLNLQSLYSSPGATISFGKIITTGLMGSVMLLIAAFIFFAVALLFIIRYVVLILVLILSPLAFIAFVLPQAKKYQGQWLDALIGQAFFAPIYMMLTWVTVKILNGITESQAFGTQGALAEIGSEGFIGTFINYIIVIVFLVVSLIVAKDWAGRTPGGFNKLSGWALGAAGGATMGTVGRFGRNIIGSRAAAIAGDEALKRRAAEGSMSAKLQLATAGRASKASFDLRGSRIGGTFDAGKAPKGGFVEDQKNRTKAYAAYKPSDGAKKAAEEEARKAKDKLDEARRKAAERAATEVPVSSSLTEAERELNEARAATESSVMGVSPEDRAAEEARIKERIKAAERKVAEEKANREAQIEAYVEEKTAPEKETYENASTKKQEIDTRMEKMAKKLEGALHIPGFMPSGKDKAKAIRAAAKEKSKKEKLAEAAAEAAKEEAEASGEAEKPKEDEGGEKKAE